jgi:hypothetical protein
MLKIVIAVVLLGHGIGHSLGLLQTLRIASVNPTWDGQSWILSGVAGPTVTQLVGIVVWSVALIGFVILAGVVMGWLPVAWWVPLAILSSIASLIGVVLFPTAFPTFSTIGAVAVDVAVLVGVIWADWSPTDLPA